jgi:hypothetical protein
VVPERVGDGAPVAGLGGDLHAEATLGKTGEEFGRSPGLAAYVRIGLVLSMLATIGGALGSALESDDVVREAAYGYRADE